MSNFISPATVKKIGALLSDGHSVRTVGRALGLNRKTVTRYAKKLQPEKCPCGLEARHKGWCGPRYLKSRVHKEVLAKINADYVDPPKPDRATLRKLRRKSKSDPFARKYPYCRGRPSDRGTALIATVDAVVSKRLPDDSRADICQELLLMILEDDLQLADLIPASQRETKRRAAMFSSLLTISLDSVSRSDDAGRPVLLIETIPEDYDPVIPKNMRLAPGMTVT